MFKSTLIAALTTAALAAGSMGAATGTASAAQLSFQISGPGYSFGTGPGYRHHQRGPRFARHQVCRPVYKERTVWTKWGPRKTVKVTERCRWVRR